MTKEQEIEEFLVLSPKNYKQSFFQWLVVQLNGITYLDTNFFNLPLYLLKGIQQQKRDFDKYVADN